MKFTIQRNKLIESLQDVAKAISPRTAIPILTGIKIDARETGITITGSDSDISIQSFIPSEEDGIVYVENIEAGQIVLQAKYFPEIIRKLPENIVDIEVGDQLSVTIRSGKAEFNLNGLDADEYPHLPNLESEMSFKMPAMQLKGLIRQTVFAVSTMETRPILTGVNIQLHDSHLTFTATDSHRLASRSIPIEGLTDQTITTVVPGKSLNELNKILLDTEDLVEINMTQNQILFRTDHLYFLSRLLDGNYPETSRLIPEEHKTTLKISAKDLLHTIDRASLLAKDDRNNVVKLTSKGSQLLEIAGQSPEIGHVTEELEIDEMSGEEIGISFSAKYMMDALKTIDDDHVIIEFTGAMRPFVIRPINQEPILQLILPVRTF